MHYIGIDQSLTSTGVCIINDEGGLVHHQVISTSKEDGDLFDRALTIARELVTIAKNFQKSGDVFISIEGLAFSKFGNATRDLAGLQCAIITLMMHLGVIQDRSIFLVTSPNELKRFATGKGNATKVDMFESIPPEHQNELSIYLKTKGRYDVADAYWLSQIALKKHTAATTSET